MSASSLLAKAKTLQADISGQLRQSDVSRENKELLKQVMAKSKEIIGLLENMTGISETDNKLYKVVVNQLKQYSIVAPASENAEDWKDTGFIGTNEECSEFISNLVMEGESPKYYSEPEPVPASAPAPQTRIITTPTIDPALAGLFNVPITIKNKNDHYLGFKGQNIWMSDQLGGYEKLTLAKTATGHLMLSNKDHQRIGFADGKLVVREAAEEGKVGTLEIRFNGDGTFRIMFNTDWILNSYGTRLNVSETAEAGSVSFVLETAEG